MRRRVWYEGKITTIMGANGCGKSTLFSLMTKNLYPKKGNIFLKGRNLQNLSLKEFARRVAIAYSDHVIGMRDGGVLVEGNPEQVITEENIRKLYGIELGMTRVDGRKFVLAV